MSTPKAHFNNYLCFNYISGQNKFLQLNQNTPVNFKFILGHIKTVSTNTKQFIQCKCLSFVSNH